MSHIKKEYLFHGTLLQVSIQENDKLKKFYFNLIVCNMP